MSWPTQQGIWRGGDLTLRSGAVLSDTLLSWKAHGTLSDAKDNVIASGPGSRCIKSGIAMDRNRPQNKIRNEIDESSFCPRNSMEGRDKAITTPPLRGQTWSAKR